MKQGQFFQQMHSNALTMSRAILFLFFLCSSSFPGTAFGILGGSDASYPFDLNKSSASLIELYQNRVWLTNCNASLLSEQIIVTAAHCLLNKPKENFLVNFSNHELVYKKNAETSDPTKIEADFTVRRIQSFRIHPNFDGSKDTQEFDIALALLDGSAPFESRPVRVLPSDLFEGLKTQGLIPLLIFGSGATNERSFESPSKLQWARTHGTIENGFVVSDQSNGSGACSGDSGGPAFVVIDNIPYQIGVISGPYLDSKTCHDRGALVSVNLQLEFIKNAEREFINLYRERKPAQ